MTAAIVANGLSKSYRILHEHQRGGYQTLRDNLGQILMSPLRMFQSRTDTDEEEFWAVNDVSFTVQPGEVVGIIGRNGAGKSTLLKILSRITKPTRGRCTIHGRMGSLLEVGTGFHPELTGRENIFMNGSLLGMTRREIQSKFDEIVAFSEIEKFLDTPVKRYSSGMYVRLAFAIAAHLEPEILIVDEVLAVGDSNFQRKCLGKMEEVAAHGRTVLFVSHIMPMIQRLCGRAIVLEKGGVIWDGDPANAIRYYLNTGANSPGRRVWESPSNAPGDDVAKLHSVQILNEQMQPAEVLEIDQSFYIEVQYWKLKAGTTTNSAINIFNDTGVLLFGNSDFLDRDQQQVSNEPGLVRSLCKIPAHLMAEGTFSVLAAAVSYCPEKVHAKEKDAVQFQIVDHTTGEGVRGPYLGNNWPGVMRPMLEWQVTPGEPIAS
jgi:lipopolysaccharide transport system ATP-binding protein